MNIDQRLAKLEQQRTDTARRDLRRWATVYAQRDGMIRDARAAGLGVNEITRLTGLAKTTVIRVLAADGDQ